MPPDSGAKADTFDGPLRATIGLMQCSKDYPLLDHLAGAARQRGPARTR